MAKADDSAAGKSRAVVATAQTQGDADDTGTLHLSWAGPEASVLVIAFDNPPANALTGPIRAKLIAALTQHAKAAQAVVLIGSARGFSSASGLDLLPSAPPGGSARDQGEPSLAQLCLTLEQMPVPVVAAVGGLVLGAGAELALAVHARVAGPMMRFALPGISLGLSPEAGASQRLPRLVGAREALAMLLQARVIGPEEAVAIGLVDEAVEATDHAALRDAAITHALRMSGPRPTASRREGLANPADYTAALSAARNAALRNPLPAPLRIIDCVEAALYLPFDNGLSLEAVAHEDLAASPEAAGLIAAARGARHLSRLAALGGAEGHTAIGVLGADAALAGLVALALEQGIQVFWYAEDRAALAEAVDLIAAKHLGKAWEAARARLHLLATPADLERNSGQFRIAIMQPGAAAPMRHADPAVLRLSLGGASEDGFGLAIAPNWHLAELALPGAAECSNRQVGQAMQLLRRLGLTVVPLKHRLGLAEHLAETGRAALRHLLATGVARGAINAALEGFGQAPPPLPEMNSPHPMRAMAQTDILNRWLGAMATAGLGALAEGGAMRPSDLDQLMIAGQGFPRWRGGPMHQAALRGLMVLRADLRLWQEEDQIWAPHPLIDRLIFEGQRLDDLNRA